MWSKEEEQKLRDVHMAPARHTREKLAKLVKHFKKGGTLFSVTHDDEPEHASQEFARKVRERTQEGKLDWVPELFRCLILSRCRSSATTRFPRLA